MRSKEIPGFWVWGSPEEVEGEEEGEEEGELGIGT